MVRCESLGKEKKGGRNLQADLASWEIRQRRGNVIGARLPTRREPQEPKTRDTSVLARHHSSPVKEGATSC